MSDGIYRRLAKHLDDLPAGFPASETGVELRILERLFTPQEAELALKLTVLPEEARVIARRAGLKIDEARTRLDEMAGKGLLFSIVPDEGPTLYMASQYAIGIWEYHVNDLDEGLIRDMNEYLPTLVDPETWQKAPQLRTIPVEKSLEAGYEVMPYERAAELIDSQKLILVAPCICRKEHDMVGEGCGRLSETCLVFGWGAAYYHRNGLGRIIDKEEAKAILAQAEKEALVLQPSNAKKVTNICCCCGCCCQVLINLKRHPQPATLVSSAFMAAADQDSCSGCGVCLKRCQMDALELIEDPDGNKRVSLNQDRCIGCGLCVTTCPTNSLRLERKPEQLQPVLPRNTMESLLKIGRARGKLGPGKLAAMSLKSKFDRLLASRD